jgi:hypothetical protein
VRHFRIILAQRNLAGLICAAALLFKLLVPTGYMIAADHGRLAITICPGVVPHVMMAGDDMPDHAMSAGHGMSANHATAPGHGKAPDHARADTPCAFAGLAVASLAAIDPIQLAALIAFVLSLALAQVVVPPPSRRAQLRPPLRGPPAYR